MAVEHEEFEAHRKNHYKGEFNAAKLLGKKPVDEDEEVWIIELKYIKVNKSIFVFLHCVIKVTASCINLFVAIGALYSHVSLTIEYRSTKSKLDPLNPPSAYMYWQSDEATAASVHLL